MFAHYVLGHRRSLPSGLILTAGIAALLAAAPAIAATWEWTGDAGNNSWNNSGNWNPVSPPANDGTAVVSFGDITRLTPDLTLPWNVNAVNFLSSAGAFNLFSTLGNTLTVGAGGLTNYDADIQTISHAITLSAAQTWSAESGNLSIAGPVNNGGHLLTIDSAVTKNEFIGGVLSGSGGLTKNGLGDMHLSGSSPNTYTGTTTLNSGTMQLNKSGVNAIPGSLDIGDGVGTAIDTLNPFVSNQIADSATVNVFSTGAWALGAITFTNSETITNLNIVSTGIAGGGLVKIGDGALNVLGNLTMTGGTVSTNGAGVLQINSSLTTNASGLTASISSRLDLRDGTRTFTIADGAAPNDLDVTGVVSFGGIIKNGPGVLRLGAANTYTGGTTLNAGTISIGADAALGTAAVTINAGGILRYTASATVGRSIFLGGGTLEAPSGISLLNAGGVLQGEGTAIGNVANAGSVILEGATGLLHVEGNYSQSSLGKLVLFADLSLPPGSNSRLDVTGDAALNGILQMNLTGGMGQFRGTRSFDVLDWTGSLNGTTFSTLQLPMFGGMFTWDTSQLYTSGVLTLTGPPPEADYNHNGVVDAADYAVWRKTGGNQAAYDLWRQQFGIVAGVGSGSAIGSLSDATVPEPASAVILLFAAAACCLQPSRAA